MNITYIIEKEDGVERFIPTLDGERLDGYDHFALVRPKQAPNYLKWYGVLDLDTGMYIALGQTEIEATDTAVDDLKGQIIADAEDAADLAQTHRDGYEAWTRG